MNNFQNRLRMLIHEEESKQEQKRITIGRYKRLLNPPRFQSGGKMVEITLVVVLLSVALLCGCCEPFRIWFLSVVHALASR